MIPPTQARELAAGPGKRAFQDKFLKVSAAALVLFLGANDPALAAGYENLLEQGLFYLSRGAAYGPDAVRSLEKARETDPERAAEDAQWLSATARGYIVTNRYSEAFWLVEELAATGQGDPEAVALRERLLFESGLGRIRIVSAVPVPGLVGRLHPSEGTRLDVASRKALEKLNELLTRELTPGPGGVTLLAPEGRFELSLRAGSLAAPREPVTVEVWAGDESTLRLVPTFPKPSAWNFRARSRSIDVSWPSIAGLSHRLYRLDADPENPIYQGSEARFTDTGLAVGVRVTYRLESINERGELVATSQVEAETLPPVSRVRFDAALGDDLGVELTWALGPGAADRVRVTRRGMQCEELVGEVSSPDPLNRGRMRDGPFRPQEAAQELHYRVEVWVAEEQTPAAVAGVDVEIPPRVVRVTQISESIDHGSLVVLWDTLPREGVAEGYAVFRRRDDEAAAELVGRVKNPFAREFVYEVVDGLAASDWRHFVVPYVGDRYFLDPEQVEVHGAVPNEGFEARRGRSKALPDVGLSWDPYPGARRYAVDIDEKEVLVEKPYVEIEGLQTPLMATDRQVSVYAVDADNRRVPLLTMELRYQHYRRSRIRGEDP